jgi:hypothetical protein
VSHRCNNIACEAKSKSKNAVPLLPGEPVDQNSGPLDKCGKVFQAG